MDRIVIIPKKRMHSTDYCCCRCDNQITDDICIYICDGMEKNDKKDHVHISCIGECFDDYMGMLEFILYDDYFNDDYFRNDDGTKGLLDIVDDLIVIKFMFNC